MKNLPKSLVNQLTMENLQKEYDRKQDLLQKSVAEISRLRNISISSVEQFEVISHKWIEDEISKSKESLKTVFGDNGGFIPAGISKQFDDEYNRVRQECFGHIDGIIDIRNWCEAHGIGIKIDSKGRPWLNEKDVKEAVLKEATRTFSEEERHYYTLLGDLFASLNEIHRYEKLQGMAHASFDAILHEENLARIVTTETSVKLHEWDFGPEKFLSWLNWGKVCRSDEKAEY